jgi:hypothetical protein
VTQKQVGHLTIYCEIARKIMLKFMTPNSCIAATRVTIEWCKLNGIKAKPMTCQMALTIKGMSVVYTSGLDKEELAKAEKVSEGYGQGWRGHLVAVVEDTLILDSSLDQANCIAKEHGEILEHLVYAFPFEQKVSRQAKMGIDGTLNSGMRFTLQYLMKRIDGYDPSEAWDDAGLPFLARVIDTEVKRVMAEKLYEPHKVMRKNESV